MPASTNEPPSAVHSVHPHTEVQRRADLMQRVVEVELEVAAKAEDALRATHRVDIGVRATVNGRVWEFDAVAYPNESFGKAVVFDVKYMTKATSIRARVVDALGHAAAGADILPGGAIPVVVAVYRDATMLGPERFEQLRHEAAYRASTFNNVPRLLILSEYELNAMSAETFRAAIGL